MSELKTRPNNRSVDAFIDAVEPEWKRDDAKEILSLMKKLTGEDPVMWGDSIIGFGNYRYKYESGKELDWFFAGFSPRKANMTIYMMGGFNGHDEYLKKLGKHKKSVGCLYFKRISDVDVSILEQMIVKSIETIKKRYADYN